MKSVQKVDCSGTFSHLTKKKLITVITPDPNSPDFRAISCMEPYDKGDTMHFHPWNHATHAFNTIPCMEPYGCMQGLAWKPSELGCGRAHLTLKTAPTKESCFYLFISLTENSDDFLVLDDFQRPAGDEAQLLDALASVEQQVPGRRVVHLEVDGQCPQTALRGQSECRVLPQDVSVQVDRQVCPHVFGGVVHDLKGQRSASLSRVRIIYTLAVVHDLIGQRSASLSRVRIIYTLAVFHGLKGQRSASLSRVRII